MKNHGLKYLMVNKLLNISIKSIDIIYFIIFVEYLACHEQILTYLNNYRHRDISY